MIHTDTGISQLDLYAELISYTLYLTGRPPLDTDAERISLIIDRLILRSQEYSLEQLAWQKVQWLEGFFPVAAWIDERLQNSAWPGHQGWVKKSLQRRFFNSSIAGQEFFKRLDALDENRNDLREIYDFCLALGFHGRFFEENSEDQIKLEAIRQENLAKFQQEDIALTMPAELFPLGETRALPVVRGSLISKLQTIFWWLLPVSLVVGLHYYLSDKLFELIP